MRLALVQIGNRTFLVHVPATVDGKARLTCAQIEALAEVVFPGTRESAPATITTTIPTL